MKSFKGMPCGRVNSHSKRGAMSGSYDCYSVGYDDCIKDIRWAMWYDVLPYSTALWISNYRDNIRSGSWWLHRESYINLCIEYVVSGVAERYVDGKCVLMNQGDMWLTLPGDTVTLSDHNGSRFHRLQIIISGSIIKIAPGAFGLSRQRSFNVKKYSNQQDFKQLCDQVAEVMMSRKLEQAQENSRLAYELLLFFATMVEKDRQNTEELPGVLTNTIDRMIASSLDDYSIASLAARVGVSRMTLNRLFRNYLSTTPLAYWMKVKMEYACQLLQNSNVPIKEISAELGFRNQLYFSTVFRRHIGVSPSEFRQRREK